MCVCYAGLSKNKCSLKQCVSRLVPSQTLETDFKEKEENKKKLVSFCKFRIRTSIDLNLSTVLI